MFPNSSLGPRTAFYNCLLNQSVVITLCVASQREVIVGRAEAIHNFVMLDVKELSICIRVCLKLRKSAPETHETEPGFPVGPQNQRSRKWKSLSSPCIKQARQVRWNVITILISFGCEGSVD